ncbi:Fc.00g022170.m01.CDS01 [Cosmosporella sp. VM-42]
MGQDPSRFRCSSCPTYVDPAGDRILRLWESYGELHQSAESGCDLCELCRQSLAHAASLDKLRQVPGEVRLYGYKDHWSLDCPALPGSFGLPLPLLESKEDSGVNIPRSLRSDRDIFGQALEWLESCVSHHPDCESIAANIWSPRELPKRLIDLRQENTLLVFNCEDRIRTGALYPDSVKYCTLSYRWGDTPHSCVLTEPFDHSLPVIVRSMPQTFQDAVKVARRLGIRYLWIDALCIVQPSSGDDTEWLEEGSRMGTIYQNAICTIAATASLHANQGFLGRTGNRDFPADPVVVYVKDGDEGHQKKHYLPVTVPSFYDCVSHSPLNSRGWVVQERALSTRIIHFTEHGVFWECGSLKAHNVYGTLQNRDDFPSCRSRETLLSVARTKRTRHVCPVEWFHFVKQYSYTGFTNPQDRLLALSSVAKAVQPYLGGHGYIAGLWKNDIIRGLAWKCHRPHSQTADPKIPSWSWAAALGGIELLVFAIRMYRYDLVELLDIAATPVSAANPFGRLIRGSVTLKGKLALEWLPRTARTELTQYNPDLNIYWDDAQNLDGFQTRTVTEKPSKPELQRYPLLPIARDKPPLDSKTYVGALILEPTGKAEVVQIDAGEILRSEFRRIGWLEYTYRANDINDRRSYWDERGAEEVVLI